MEKSYLHLEGRTPEDVHRELMYFYVAIERLSKLKKDSFEYVAIYDDLRDRMRGFKNYFSQDLDSIIKDVMEKKTNSYILYIPQFMGDFS